MQVREVMTKSPVCCPPDMPLQDVARLMVEFDCGEIPIVQGQAKRPVGVITDRDIACRVVAQGKNPLELTARDCMTSPAITVTPETPLDECCRTMESHQIRRVPVVDEGGSCCGIVSQADLVLRTADGQSVRVVKEVSRHRGPAAQTEPQMAADPVCGMRVETKTAPAKTTFQNETYYFCSAECRRKFDSSPEDYVAPA